MKVALTKGYFAIIDEIDASRVMAFKWFAFVSKSGRRICAARRSTREEIASGSSKHTLMHRFIMCEPDGLVDHKNRQPLDNRRVNLRACTYSQNAQNSTGKGGPLKGFTLRGKWLAKIFYRGKERRLGLWGSPIEAARAYDVGAIELFGDFACLNFTRTMADEWKSMHPHVFARGKS